MVQVAAQQQLFETETVGEYGSIAIRVVVLPPKAKKKDNSHPLDALPVDLEADEFLAESAAATPLGSYLESSKGKRCCVFLVNGQRQEALDNSFIVQDLGFKYLRSRMMIIVEVDGLTPEALGRLMQGSRQGFYRGDIWNAITKRMIAALKNDPDLVRLEEEAEEQVAELRAGDEKVRQALDQLIDAHHEHGAHVTAGRGAAGASAGEELGFSTVTTDGVVSLLPPDSGQTADYPVLQSQPASSIIRLRPNVERVISIKSLPSNHWPAIAEFIVANDKSVPELTVAHEHLDDHGTLSLRFREPDGFDTDQYPVRAKVAVTARFNGIKEPRQLDLSVLVKPDKEPAEPTLLDEPTRLTVSSREPIRVRTGDSDTHVRLRWDGKDHLLTSDPAEWQLSARRIGHGVPQPVFNFSEPNAGRFSLLISPRPEWRAGDSMEFEVLAFGRSGKTLSAKFNAEVIDPPHKEPKTAPKPQLVDGAVVIGSNRRPPYELRYIDRDRYEELPCWNRTSWTDSDAGSYVEPTDRAPLTLIINTDMEALREFKRVLTKTNTEPTVQRKVNSYTSHIAFHLYQMYQASQNRKEDDLDAAEERRCDEIKRVASTLIKLMDVGNS